MTENKAILAVFAILALLLIGLLITKAITRPQGVGPTDKQSSWVEPATPTHP